MSFTIKVNHTFSESDIKNLFIAAIDGGLSDWYTYYEMPEDLYSEIAAEDQAKKMSVKEQIGLELARSCCVEFVAYNKDGNEKKSYILTSDKLKAGMEKYFNKQDNPSLDSGDWDADVADKIFQYALFGEVVFS